MEGAARERRWDGSRGALLAIGPVALTAGLRPLLGQGDVLLVVPPFAGIDRPSLGAHLLQACARAAGFAVDVFYANIEFAERIGERAYEAIAGAPTRSLVGERVFARAAYGAPRFGRNRSAVQPTLDQLCAVAGMTPGDLSGIERATSGPGRPALGRDQRQHRRRSPDPQPPNPRSARRSFRHSHDRRPPWRCRSSSRPTSR